MTSGPYTTVLASTMDDSPRSIAEAPARESLAQAFRKWLKSIFSPRQDASLKEALEEAIEEHEEQSEEQLAPEEKLMLHNVLSFGDTKVGDVMVPRTEISAVPLNITLPALKRHILEQQHTRIPVYKDTLDQVQGFIHVKDLVPMISEDKPYDLKSALHPILFVPPSMPIIDLLVRMRHAGGHLAIVVDEHGGTDGLVTMENIFEELVGDIQDEHDEDEEHKHTIQKVGDHAYEVDARILVDILERDLDLGLLTGEEEGEFETLGGLIFFHLGRVPARGEIVPHPSGVRFEILEADMRRIRRVRILTDVQA